MNANLFDSIQNSIISDSVLCALSPVDIHKLSLTCRVANEAVTSYRRCAWNINNRLRRFFNDPLAFRSVQARTDTIISGSFALQFFDRTCYPDTDLDICVPLEHVLEVGRWLLDPAVGYNFQPSETQPQNFEVAAGLIKKRNIRQAENLEDAFTGVAAVFFFIRPSDDRPSVKVRVSVAESSVFKIIFNSSSTCTMNIITFNKACCFYPRSSFHEYRSLITAHGEGDHKVVIRGCEGRGWKMDEEPPSTNPTLFPRCRRWVGDKFCWTISLTLEGVGYPTTSQIFPVELNGWSLTPTRREPVLRLPNKDWRARCIVLRSPVLRFKYALPKTTFWVDFLSQWVHSPTISPSGEIMYEDAAVRTHIEFCTKFSNNLDTIIEEEQHSHHRTLVAYHEELKVLRIRMEASEKKMTDTEGLALALHTMEQRVDGITKKVNDFVVAVGEWVGAGQSPERFIDLVREFTTLTPLSLKDSEA